jgi:hypothetical protein
MAELGYQEGKNFTFDHMQISGTEAWEASYRRLTSRLPTSGLLRAQAIAFPGMGWWDRALM